MADKRFDDILKNKLDQHRVDKPADWDVFSQKMAAANLDASFDNDIKSELQDYTTGSPDWPVFSDKLTEALSPDGTFDHAINDALQNHTAGTPDWAVFADKLAAAQSPDLSFDELIKEKVANTEKGKADWNAFSQKLNKELDSNFDEEVAETLDNHRRSYVSEHWILLQERLKQIAYLKGSILRIKGLEIACMFALLLTSYNVFNYLWSKQPVTIAEQQIMASVETNKTAALSSEVKPLNKLSELQSQSPESSQFIKENEGKTTADNAVAQTRVAEVMLSQISNNEANNKPLANVSKNNAKTLASETLSSIESSSYSTNDDIALNLTNTSKSVLSKDRSRLSIATLNNGALMALVSEEDERATIKLASDFSPLKEKVLDDCNPSGWTASLALETGVDQFTVLTPYDPTFDVDAYEQQGSARSQGVLLQVNYGQFGLSTGISQRSMQYEPTGIIDTFGNEDTKIYFIKSLDQIRYDYLSVPMQLGYTMNLNHSWKLTASSGFSYQWIRQTDYPTSMVRIDHKEVENKGEKSEASAVDVQIDLASLRSNNFWRFTSGISLERCFGKYGSLFLRPSYEQSLNSTAIGPNRDKFNQWNVSLGYKYTFLK